MKRLNKAALALVTAYVLSSGVAQAQLSLLQGEVSVQTAGEGVPNNVVRDP